MQNICKWVECSANLQGDSEMFCNNHYKIVRWAVDTEEKYKICHYALCNEKAKDILCETHSYKFLWEYGQTKLRFDRFFVDVRNVVEYYKGEDKKSQKNVLEKLKEQHPNLFDYYYDKFVKIKIDEVYEYLKYNKGYKTTISDLNKDDLKLIYKELSKQDMKNLKEACKKDQNNFDCEDLLLNF